MHQTAANATHIYAAACNDLGAWVHIAADQHRTLGTDFLAAPQRAVHDHHLLDRVGLGRFFLCCCSRTISLLRPGLCPLWLAINRERPRHGPVAVLIRFLHTANQAMLMEKMLHLLTLGCSKRIPWYLHQRTAQKKSGAGLQLTLQMLHDILKGCLGRKSQQQTGFAALNLDQFFTHCYPRFIILLLGLGRLSCLRRLYRLRLIQAESRLHYILKMLWRSSPDPGR